jgi:hypothetical protein
VEPMTRAGHVELVPPRFWWLKRVGLGIGVVVALAVGLRIVLGIIAGRALERRITSYHAAGEPILPEDFDSRQVPEDENAVPLLERAEAAWQLPADVPEAMLEIRDLTTARSWRNGIRRGIEANQKGLALLREARSRRGTDWGIRLTSPLQAWVAPKHESLRRLLKLASLSAIDHHLAGNDDQAVQVLLDVLDSSRRLEHVPSEVGHMWALSAAARALPVVEAISPALMIGGGEGENGPAEKSVGRDEVLALIRMLLDENAAEAGLVLAACFLRAADYDQRRRPGDRDLLLRPVWQLDMVEMFDWNTGLVRAAGAAGYAESQSRLAAVGEPASLPRSVLWPLLPYVTDLDNARQIHWKNLAERRMAAAALAIRLFELDHGRRPAALAELTTDYLPSIPRDPFATGSEPLAYRPAAEKPVLYSVGPDGRDENGRVVIDGLGVERWRDGDIVFYLAGDRPPSGWLVKKLSSASQQTDQDPDVQNGQRDSQKNQQGDSQP